MSISLGPSSSVNRAASQQAVSNAQVNLASTLGISNCISTVQSHSGPSRLGLCSWLGAKLRRIWNSIRHRFGWYTAGEILEKKVTSGKEMLTRLFNSFNHSRVNASRTTVVFVMKYRESAQTGSGYTQSAQMSSGSLGDIGFLEGTRQQLVRFLNDHSTNAYGSLDIGMQIFEKGDDDRFHYRMFQASANFKFLSCEMDITPLSEHFSVRRPVAEGFLRHTAEDNGLVNLINLP